MAKKLNNNYSQLLAGISQVAAQLDQAKKQAVALGIFTNDRELLECSGLMEDVLTDGRLITYHGDSRKPDDRGLRFEKIDEENFRCPVCGTILKADVP